MLCRHLGTAGKSESISVGPCLFALLFFPDATVLLPEHLHLLMTLLSGQTDYSAILKNIKSGFTRTYLAAGGIEQKRSASRLRQGTRGVWLSGRNRDGGAIILRP